MSGIGFMSSLLSDSEVVYHCDDNSVKMNRGFNVTYNGRRVLGISAIVFCNADAFRDFKDNIVDLGFDLVDTADLGFELVD